MSKVLNTNTSYDIINRKELLADSNTSATGALNTAISNPVQKPDAAYMLSRVGDVGNTDRKPTPGYCLHFDSTNVISVDSIYIQTNIPSTERANYNIVIKGEGTIDLLQVDTSDTNIRIVPKQAITDTAYFDLSYIAFRNITTGKIDHLFECEENSGTLLYDAVTGDTATITSSSGNIVSLSTLRGFTPYKEWIINEDENLNDAIAVKNTWVYNNSVKNIPASYSLCMTLAITKEQFDTTAAIGDINLCGNVNGYNLANWLLVGRTYWSIRFNYRNNDLSSTIYSCVIPLWIDSYNIKYLDGKPHKYVACVDAETKTLKTYIDSVYVNSNGNQILSYTPVDFTATNQFDIGTNNKYRLDGGFKISNIKRFDFAMDATDAPYTLQDYQNGKDIPENVTPLIDLVNISKSPESADVWSGLWLDRSPNNHNLQFYANATYNNSYIAATKNYGTWCNGVGYNETGNIKIPRKLLN